MEISVGLVGEGDYSTKGEDCGASNVVDCNNLASLSEPNVYVDR